MKINNKTTPSQSQICQFDYSKYVVINSHQVKAVELECSLCYRILYQSVTTPCGHSFCLKCLERALDHRDQCPLCKNSLTDYLAERRQFTTQFIDRLIRTYYSAEYAERKRQYTEEMKELIADENEISVFVCTLALPFAPCPLHIYEPRYRLMLRRAIETGKKEFGMTMYSERTVYKYAEYGCMLQIQSYQFTKDGRSIVSTIGGKRFRVLKSGTKDGYNTAKVEWVKDVKVESEVEKTELLNLHDEVYRLATTWYSFIPDTQKNRILEIYGIDELPLPEADIQTDDGPYWHWFLLNILPLDSDLQYKFLTKTSLKERLKQMKKIMIILMAPPKNLLIGSMSNSNSNNNSLHQQQQQLNQQSTGNSDQINNNTTSNSINSSLFSIPDTTQQLDQQNPAADNTNLQ